MAAKVDPPQTVAPGQQQQNGVLIVDQQHLIQNNQSGPGVTNNSQHHRRPSATPPQPPPPLLHQNSNGSNTIQQLLPPLKNQQQANPQTIFHQQQTQQYDTQPTWALQPQPQQLYSMGSHEYVNYYPFGSHPFVQPQQQDQWAFGYQPTSQPSNPYAQPPPPPPQPQQPPEQQHQSPYGGMSMPYAGAGGLMDYVSHWTPSVDTTKPHQDMYTQYTTQQQHITDDYEALARNVHQMNIGLGVAPSQQQHVQPPPPPVHAHPGGRPATWADRVKAAPREQTPRGRQRGSIAGNANRAGGAQPSGASMPPVMPPSQQHLGKAPSQAPPGWGPQRNVGPLVAMPPPNMTQQQAMRNGWPQDGLPPAPGHQQQQQQHQPSPIILPPMPVRTPIGVVGPPTMQSNQHMAQQFDEHRINEQHIINHGSHNVSSTIAQPQAVASNNTTTTAQNEDNMATNGASIVVNKQQQGENSSPSSMKQAAVTSTNNKSTPPKSAVIEPATATTTLDKLRRETNPSKLELPPKNARYFVIKSYSEDDVHRSIKYGIWCSTEHGNKRLDNAFKQSLRQGQGPIYLLFSVNASGHFCGMAQMVSAVDYSKQSNVWGSDKYKGLFKVKWVYVKDVPNQQLRHIRLENNENKPVTNSRDTQEVPAEKGRQTLRVIHEYKSTTSLFDDFVHYEKKQLEEDSRRGRNTAAAPIVG